MCYSVMQSKRLRIQKQFPGRVCGACAREINIYIEAYTSVTPHFQSVIDNMYTVFPLLHDERNGPPHCFSKPPCPKYAVVATS